MSSVAFSPEPAAAVLWASVYVAVVVVVHAWFLSSSEPVDGVRRLIQLNWVIATIIAIALFLVAEQTALSKGRFSVRELTGSAPWVLGMPMARQTGLGRYLGILAIVALVRALGGRRGRWGWSLVGAATLMGVMLAQSRSTFAGLAVGVVTVLVLSRRPQLLAGLAAIGLLVFLLFQEEAINYVMLRGRGVVGSVWPFFSGRPDIWAAALELARDSPVCGWGFHADRFLLEWPFKNHISNAPLHALVQSGIVGTVPFVLGWLATWWALARAFRRSSGHPHLERSFLIEVMGVLSFLTVRAMFESTGAFFGVDWLLLAPLIAYAETVGGRSAATPLQVRSAPVAEQPPELTSELPVYTILGVRVHPLPVDAVVRWIEGRIDAKARGRCVVASGMHAIVEAHRDHTFRRVLDQADLFVPDGYSLLWLARRHGFSLNARVCGTDLVVAFCARAARKGYGVFFYGDTESVLNKLEARLRHQFPTLHIAGSFSPPFRQLTSEEQTAVVRMINEAAPDVLWVGLGLPKQERWMMAFRDRLNVPVLVGVGAAFKFVSGSVRRAPRWMRDHGLEWLWRFACEPRRLWRRALIDVPMFTTLILLELSGAWKSRPPAERSSGEGTGRWRTMGGEEEARFRTHEEHGDAW